MRFAKYKTNSLRTGWVACVLWGLADAERMLSVNVPTWAGLVDSTGTLAPDPLPDNPKKLKERRSDFRRIYVSGNLLATETINDPNAESKKSWGGLAKELQSKYVAADGNTSNDVDNTTIVAAVTEWLGFQLPPATEQLLEGRLNDAPTEELQSLLDSATQLEEAANPLLQLISATGPGLDLALQQGVQARFDQPKYVLIVDGNGVRVAWYAFARDDMKATNNWPFVVEVVSEVVSEVGSTKLTYSVRDRLDSELNILDVIRGDDDPILKTAVDKMYFDPFPDWVEHYFDPLPKDHAIKVKEDPGMGRAGEDPNNDWQLIDRTDELLGLHADNFN